MPDRQPDSRTLNFAGDVDELGRPLPTRAASMVVTPARSVSAQPSPFRHPDRT